ncbi:MAG TPA: hypothetical protein VGO07_04145 [Candidatus Saccharimonadales bacterium]|jgi:hypothetical protein|nr:hypothetical protein [Candidatus Saccharimonadales bacterium]
MHVPHKLAIKGKKASFYSLSALLALTAVFVAIQSAQVSAGTLSTAFVRFDRLKISQATTGTVCAKPFTVGAETQVQVTFPTGYTLGLAATFTTNTTNLSWPATAQPWITIGSPATSVAGQVVTFSSGDLTVGTLYCFNWINSAAVQVKSSATSNNSGTIATNLDSASFSTQSITDDQIAVTASVAQAFSFALSANSDALGALTTGAVATSPTPRTVTVNTNSNGWIVWSRDVSAGLSSPSTSALIGSTTPGTNSTQAAGTQGYNMGVTVTQTSGSAVPAVDPIFDGTTLSHGGGLDTTLRSITSSTGSANNAVLTLKNNAAISATTTAAADYADTITVVGAGMF